MTAIHVLILSALLTAADQFLKYLIKSFLNPFSTVVLIPGVLDLRYGENTGGAFSILTGQTFMLSLISLIIIIILIVVLFKGIIKTKFALLAVSFIIAGGLGNFIDRAFRGYVIDYLNFSFINFPVFNLADSMVVVGEILLAVYILFFHDKSKSLIKR